MWTEKKSEWLARLAKNEPASAPAASDKESAPWPVLVAVPRLGLGHRRHLALLWHFKSMPGFLSRGYADRNRFYATA